MPKFLPFRGAKLRRGVKLGKEIVRDLSSPDWQTGVHIFFCMVHAALFLCFYVNELQTRGRSRDWRLLGGLFCSLCVHLVFLVILGRMQHGTSRQRRESERCSVPRSRTTDVSVEEQSRSCAAVGHDSSVEPQETHMSEDVPDASTGNLARRTGRTVSKNRE
mmetsp:Transcript_68668/g.108336  ORF Transcript_68668/g.108336 Transcript_68668/m.108336 type:complete len:162 (+) Transcript_68668:56-541(+)